MKSPQFLETAYRAITLSNIRSMPEWHWLPPDLQEAVRVVGQVLPFRTNLYVTRHLIDWSRLPDDPIFQLTFPQPSMLPQADYEAVWRLLNQGADQEELQAVVREIQLRMNPHPAGQLSHNVPTLNGRELQGLQHKYRETVLYFPGQGQTCHAYCTYCFRWPQFMKIPGMKFHARDSRDLVAYLRRSREVSDLLVTGGDPMIMKARLLREHLEPILDPSLNHVQTIRIGTKSLSYWPARFVTDPDADELLAFLEQVVASGRHLAIMAHFSHAKELATPLVVEAIRRIRSTGAEIRTQAPIIRHVNDNAAVWSEMWRTSVRLGMVPYYMFVERDTGPREYFRMSLWKAHRIYHEAVQKVSGLARTVRGPSMSAFPGKIQILGTAQIGRDKVFVLQFLQGRQPDWVGRPFFAEWDPDANWLDDLRPAFGRQHFFFESEDDFWAASTVA
ncbi:MAG: lysine 2,3-aminomutase [Acidobacteriota bacterium]